MTRIALKDIKHAARQMARAVHPRRIILFGSHAYGRPKPQSDVDFLLVLDGKSKKAKENAYLQASKALDPRPFSVDIVVRFTDEITRRINEGDYFLEEVMKKGRPLYEK